MTKSEETKDFWLTGFLTLLSINLFAVPFIAEFFPWIEKLARPFLLLTFLAAPQAVAEGRRDRLTFSSIALAIAIIALIEEITLDPWTRRVLGALIFSFLVLLASFVLKQVLRAGEITSHRIKGAIAFYLLVGVIFQVAFTLIELVRPGSFALAEPLVSFEHLTQQMSHLSFVTLTTVGYGNIVPVSGAARALCNFEALIGQLYPAILLARLVSLQVSAKKR